MTKKHTPTPWVLDDDGDGDYKIISEEGRLIAVETSYYPIAPSVEDAAHIVKCVNMHDELVEALKWAKEQLEVFASETMGEDFNSLRINEALKKAGAL